MGSTTQINQDFDIAFKVVIIGDRGVGKTCLLDRFTDGVFGETITSTLCVDFKIRKVDMDNKVVKLYMWDTAGQERFLNGMPFSYYRKANGIFLAFDIANIKSFQNLGKWVADFDEKSSDKVAKVLVGTKSDLGAQRVVPYDMAKEYADQIGVPYIETSAKTDHNVEQTFLKITEEMKKDFDSGATEMYQTYKPKEFQDVGPKKGTLGYYLCSC